MVTLGAREAAEVEMDGGDPITANSRSATSEVRSSRSHSEAERKRRQRINGHLATLRSLLPSATRMDKAALLGEVVRHVRELREKVDDVAVGVVVPGEGDEIGVDQVGGPGDDEGKRVRAWVCCADRPGLMGDLNRAVGSVRAKAGSGRDGDGRRKNQKRARGGDARGRGRGRSGPVGSANGPPVGSPEPGCWPGRDL
ncbi:Transcription factor AIG1 [Ananas comosus]|uniref:Transcription factor AIG1 n=1 Tax=Ananas comosus TaxID=4615 RepID=A0A199VRT3_ANACO|nr:Transcription factor AIG1 [Ananas comosus]